MSEKEAQVSLSELLVMFIFFMIIGLAIMGVIKLGSWLLTSPSYVSTPTATAQPIIPTGIKETARSQYINQAPQDDLRRMTARDYVINQSSTESTVISKESYNESNR